MITKFRVLLKTSSDPKEFNCIGPSMEFKLASFGENGFSNRFYFHHLEKGSVCAKEGKKVKAYVVYYTRNDSTVTEIPSISPMKCQHGIEQLAEDIKYPGDEKLVSYEGIITDTEASSSGIYIIDKNVKLVLSHLCLVSNIQIFKRGQKLQIINAHLEVVDEKRKLLWACGKTLVCHTDEDLNNQDENIKTESKSIHYKKDLEVFEKDAVLNLCHQCNLTTREIVYIGDIYHKQFRTKFQGIIPEQYLHSIEYFANLLKFCGLQNINSNKRRCFITEFLSVPHDCDLSYSEKKNVLSCGNKNNIDTCLITLQDFNSLVKRKLYKDREEKKEKYSKVNFQYDYCETDDVPSYIENDPLFEEYDCKISRYSKNHKCNPVIIGLLQVDPRTG